MLARFGVKSLGVFGSAARNDMRSDSDVDILEALLGTAVDLVTEDALKPRVRPFIEKDLVRVA